MKKMKIFAGLLAATALLAACSARATDTSAVSSSDAIVERNKENVLAFYEMVFNDHQVEEGTKQYIGEEYLQHNPDVADGGQAFIDAFAPFLEENPESSAEIKRVIAEGDLVALHVHSKLNADDQGEAVVDIFRLDEDGKIVEHWDVIQGVPEETASGRGMF